MGSLSIADDGPAITLKLGSGIGKDSSKKPHSTLRVADGS
jgi:hypothetical protein